MSLNELGAATHENAKAKGWWPEGEERNLGEILALIHSEVSEALEAWRDGGSLTDIAWKIKARTGRRIVGEIIQDPEHGLIWYNNGVNGRAVKINPNDPADRTFLRMQGYDCKPEGFATEMADVIIRVVETCYKYGIDLDAVTAIKMEYNATRPFRHGGKLA